MVVPESEHVSVVPHVHVEFHSVDYAIIVVVAKGKLMVDIGLKAGMVANNVL